MVKPFISLTLARADVRRVIDALSNRAGLLDREPSSKADKDEAAVIRSLRSNIEAAYESSK